jgi:hypothetical protein
MEWINYATSRVPEMQEMRIKELQAQGRELASLEGEERADRAERQQLQRPRAFCRRELQFQPFIVGRPENNQGGVRNLAIRMGDALLD